MIPPGTGTHTRSGPGAPLPDTGRCLVLAGLVGPLAYMTLVAALGLMVDGYNPVRDSMSELGAVDAPYRQVMNIGGFMGVGAAMLGFAAGYHLQLRPSRPKPAVTVLLAVAGGFMITVGFFPCDPGCVDVTATGRLHSLTSTPKRSRCPLRPC